MKDAVKFWIVNVLQIRYWRKKLQKPTVLHKFSSFVYTAVVMVYWLFLISVVKGSNGCWMIQDNFLHGTGTKSLHITRETSVVIFCVNILYCSWGSGRCRGWGEFHRGFRRCEKGELFLFSKTTFSIVVARNFFCLLTEHPPFLKYASSRVSYTKTTYRAYGKGVFLVSY